MDQKELKYTKFEKPLITLTILPSDKTQEFPRPKTVLQLFNKLGLRAGMALAIRNNTELLTPDDRILTNDHITIRKVISEG
ncbi:hypothetical protein [Desulfovibrio litoralis]|uniref:Sulfur carrier protein n=1 Tax=Desulfovibrio litoralis DSM 11393 TaxID=1121455 RepID=A0A1M7SM87_9BACT|nr:hypothetical protein [Desulfovibrio litoralis]SHN59548.1 hypothetical protein SAMN02745728_01025 [Desulfovibrio litoralis DSM 11393]